ncbi:thioredoxin family protein [Rubripirellula obstinata]|uniref:thioredoxin family protein n=1 Tax=Rubripirellula obstinata TaxID=406547 RepID=UPI00122C3680|nr:thioredoxin family protein [Rubripirellula obstinata]
MKTSLFPLSGADIDYVNEKGYQVDSTPTFMVFVDRKLQEQRSGLLRGDRLRAFLDRWGIYRQRRR